MLSSLYMVTSQVRTSLVEDFKEWEGMELPLWGNKSSTHLNISSRCNSPTLALQMNTHLLRCMHHLVERAVLLLEVVSQTGLIRTLLPQKRNSNLQYSDNKIWTQTVTSFSESNSSRCNSLSIRSHKLVSFKATTSHHPQSTVTTHLNRNSSNLPWECKDSQAWAMRDLNQHSANELSQETTADLPLISHPSRCMPLLEAKLAFSCFDP